MKIELVYTEEIDGNWFKVLKDNTAVSCFKAKDELDTIANLRANLAFEAVVAKLQNPVKKVIKSVEI